MGSNQFSGSFFRAKACTLASAALMAAASSGAIFAAASLNSASVMRMDSSVMTALSNSMAHCTRALLPPVRTRLIMAATFSSISLIEPVRCCSAAKSFSKFLSAVSSLII
jgi:hypothetical protein